MGTNGEVKVTYNHILVCISKDIRGMIAEIIWRDNISSVHEQFKRKFTVGGVKYVQSKPLYMYFNVNEPMEEYLFMELSKNVLSISGATGGWSRMSYNYRQLQTPVTHSGNLIIKKSFRNIAVLPKRYIYTNPINDYQYVNAEQGALLYIKLYPTNVEYRLR